MTVYNDIHPVFSVMEKQRRWQLGLFPSGAQEGRAPKVTTGAWTIVNFSSMDIFESWMSARNPAVLDFGNTDSILIRKDQKKQDRQRKSLRILDSRRMKETSD